MEFCLHITYRCNLACDYCCRGKNRQPALSENQAETGPQYSVKDLLSCFKRIGKQPCKGCNVGLEDRVVFSGGEPLLNQPFIEEVMQTMKADDEFTHFTYELQTNGTLLRRTNLYILKNLSVILVSIDGTKEAHDRHRKFPNGSGTYDVIMENVGWLAIQKAMGNFTGKVLARMTVDEDNDFYESVTSLIDIKKVREFICEPPFFVIAAENQEKY